MELSTQTCPWRFSGRLAGVLRKPPSAEFVEKNSGANGHCRISTSDSSKIAADRPLSKMRQCANDPKPTYVPLESGLSTNQVGPRPRRVLRKPRTMRDDPSLNDLVLLDWVRAEGHIAPQVQNIHLVAQQDSAVPAR